MSDEFTVVLAVVFVAAIPFNLYVAVQFVSAALERPRLPAATLLAQFVVVCAIVSTICAVVSVHSVTLIATDVRLLPMPLPLLGIVGALLITSLVNLLAWRYLRSRPDAE